jgi:hypothetical protein
MGHPSVSFFHITSPRPLEGTHQISAGKKKAERHDSLTVKSASIAADGKTILLELAEISACNQMHITMKLKTPEGKSLPVEIYNTIHNLAAQ